MYLLTRFTISTNAVLEAVAPRVKLRVLRLLLLLHLLDNLALLLLGEFFAVDTGVLAGDGGETFGVFFLLYGPFLRRGLFRHLGRLHIVFGCSKVKLNVCLNTADLVIGSALHDLDRVVTTPILDVNCVPFKEHGVVGELLLEDGLGVGQVDEGGLMWLDLHVGSLLKIHVPQDDLRALLNAEIVHHPDGDVAHALFRGEL